LFGASAITSSPPEADESSLEVVEDQLPSRPGVDKYLNEADRTKRDEPPWAKVKEHYQKPKLPMVFCHGLFGFDTLGPSSVPAMQISYWRGVKEALESIGVEVVITSVPASASIEDRARTLAEQISSKMQGRELNLIGHSMGGLDARFLTTHLRPTSFTVRSITTIATPHRGSPFADYLLDSVVGRDNVPSLLTLMSKLGVPGGGQAFDNLTTSKMKRFNFETPNLDEVRYFSYSASFEPSWVHVFRPAWRIIYDLEGPNDGLVSVASSKWGTWLGNLDDVNHLDLVGWLGPVRFTWADWMGKSIPFKPASFYLSLAEMLYEAGL